ncbi:hypothetical protein [Azotosporobacter soli]
MSKKPDSPEQKKPAPLANPAARKAEHPLADTDPKVLSELIRRILTEDKN